MLMYLKKILIILVVPYVLWHLYSDFLEYKNAYSYEEFKELELYGEGILSRGYYTHDRWGNRCYDYETEKGLGKLDCIRNAKIKRADFYYGSPVIYYRGQSDINKSEMCELSLSLEDEGKYAGELYCQRTWFKTSEADKIPIGDAAAYAEKLKEAENGETK